MRIGKTIARTEAEGPGVRFAIWVQGCSIKCDGCFNPHLWGLKAGYGQSVLQLTREILEAVSKSPEIEGITLLGGEPFDQSTSLGYLASEVRKHGLSVMAFTGYRLDELSGDQHALLLKNTDLLVDGKFEIGNVDFERPWVGSKNQDFHFLSPRYNNSILNRNTLDKLEIRFQTNGQIDINGWATSSQLEALLSGL